MLNQIKKEISFRVGNLVNLSTGQKKLIEEYVKAKHALEVEIKQEKNPQRKAEMLFTYKKITEEYEKHSYANGRLVGYESDSFNPNKTFQKKKLSGKVAELKKVQNTEMEK